MISGHELVIAVATVDRGGAEKWWLGVDRNGEGAAEKERERRRRRRGEEEEEEKKKKE